MRQLYDTQTLLDSFERSNSLAKFISIFNDPDSNSILKVIRSNENQTLSARFDKNIVARILAADSLAGLSLCSLSVVQQDSLESLLRSFAPQDDQWPHFPLDKDAGPDR